MADQHVLESERVAERGSIFGRPDRRDSRRPRSDVNADRNVELLREAEIRLQSRIVRGDSGILRDNLPQHLQAPGLVKGPKLVERRPLGLAHVQRGDDPPRGLGANLLDLGRCATRHRNDVVALQRFEVPSEQL
jgi:hypothetical protein